MSMSVISDARLAYHNELKERALVINEGDGKASIADKDSSLSVALANEVTKLLDAPLGKKLKAQSVGIVFEARTCAFLQRTFLKLIHLRPGNWLIETVAATSKLQIAKYEQYRHLLVLDDLVRSQRELKSIIGLDYTIAPDIIIARQPLSDQEINDGGNFVDPSAKSLSSVRLANGALASLHASISCKWTLRSDRAQNARSEALNLLRNRKGRTPHIIVVTAEPLPSRLASLALGTGDFDCIYHFALTELREAVEICKGNSAPRERVKFDKASDDLEAMIAGKRLKDISDLPLDLIA
ncbi:MAG: NgoMIV family type II restriction endonuclease [Rhodomicrobium sp.]